MKGEWQLQEAKNKLSEVIEQAIKSGPQEITKHGKKTAVIISFKYYQKLKRRNNSLVDFFRTSPLKGIAIERNKDYSRKVEL